MELARWSHVYISRHHSFHTDSKVVLGYIHNQSRRFYIYVANRIERIRKVTQPSQWFYVPTTKNPADCATRGIPASNVRVSKWLVGPSHLLLDVGDSESHASEESEDTIFPLVTPTNDKEIWPVVSVLKSNVDHSLSLGGHRFERFLSW